MSRIRTIKPGFFLNEDLAYLPPLTRLLFIGLWTLADREGRLEDRPKRIKAELLPYDACDVAGMLTELAEMGFIVRYEAGETSAIWIRGFREHQRPHPKEPESMIPQPSDAAVKRNGKTLPSRETDIPSRVDLGREGKEFQEGNGVTSAIAPVLVTAVVVRPSQKPENLYASLLASFCGSWQDHYGEPYVTTPADRSQLGRLLSPPGGPKLAPEHAAALPDCFRRYLADLDPWVVQKHRHSLCHFCTSGGMNKYRVEAVRLSEKEANGAMAARQWLARHEEKNP